jgi:hypothetical protein
MRDTTRTHGILTNELRQTGQVFTGSLAGLSPEAWLFRPAADRWSIAETAEHVALVEGSILRALTTRLADSPLADAERAGQKAKDAQVTMAMFDRSTRRPAPETVRPTGRFSEPGQASEAFATARASIIEWLTTTELDLRGLAVPHPALGLLDGKQWVLFAAAHCERHTRQILEVKQLPGYPGT